MLFAGVIVHLFFPSSVQFSFPFLLFFLCIFSAFLLSFLLRFSSAFSSFVFKEKENNVISFKSGKSLYFSMFFLKRKGKRRREIFLFTQILRKKKDLEGEEKIFLNKVFLIRFYRKFTFLIWKMILNFPWKKEVNRIISQNFVPNIIRSTHTFYKALFSNLSMISSLPQRYFFSKRYTTSNDNHRIFYINYKGGISNEKRFNVRP